MQACTTQFRGKFGLPRINGRVSIHPVKDMNSLLYHQLMISSKSPTTLTGLQLKNLPPNTKLPIKTQPTQFSTLPQLRIRRKKTVTNPSLGKPAPMPDLAALFIQAQKKYRAAALANSARKYSVRVPTPSNSVMTAQFKAKRQVSNRASVYNPIPTRFSSKLNSVSRAGRIPVYGPVYKPAPTFKPTRMSAPVYSPAYRPVYKPAPAYSPAYRPVSAPAPKPAAMFTQASRPGPTARSTPVSSRRKLFNFDPTPLPDFSKPTAARHNFHHPGPLLITSPTPSIGSAHSFSDTSMVVKTLPQSGFAMSSTLSFP